MDPVLLARIQFAMTVGFHYIFPPISIGLAWIIVWMLGRHLRTGDALYGRMARLWIRILAITFVVGVATGVTMEFQFGMNWSEYSRFVGDIFGAPLAAEGLLAFFLESTFLGALIWGEKKLGPGLRWFSALMVAVGSTLSAFWIIVANSWQQTPAGFHIVGQRAELTSFWGAVFNPSTLPRYLHVVDSSLITGALFVVGLSAWLLLRGRHRDLARESMKVGLTVGLVAALLQLPLGHVHAVQVAETQPIKLAAYEGLFQTETEADMLIFGVPNAEEARMDWALGIPGLLSFLVGFDTATEVRGLTDFPREDWPPLGLSFYPFHIMVGLGLYFIAFTVLGVWLRYRGRLTENRLFLRLALWTLPLPILANELGWIAAEVGRQPWVVYPVEGVFEGMKTAVAASPTVPAGQILASILLFGAVYALLLGLWIFLLRVKLMADAEQAPTAEVTP